MLEVYSTLYHTMLESLQFAWQQKRPILQRAEDCYWIAHGCGEQLKEIMIKHSFLSEQEEITFFRDIKPAFAGRIHYYVMLCECLLFVPPVAPSELAFWEEELTRFERFCTKHSVFIDYFKRGDRDMDSQYFLRKNKPLVQCSTMMYDPDCNCSTFYGQILCMYVAHNLYRSYVKDRINSLTEEAE